MYYYWLLCTVVRSLTFHKVEDNSTKVHQRPTASDILNQKFVLEFVGRGAFTSLIHPGHQNAVPLHRDIVAVSFHFKFCVGFTSLDFDKKAEQYPWQSSVFRERSS